VATPSKEVSVKDQRNGGGRSQAEKSVPAPFRREAPSFSEARTPVHRLFEQFFRDWPFPGESLERNWHWGFDVRETENTIVVRAEAPGFEPNDFDIQVRGELLALHAAHQAESKDDDRDDGFHEWQQQELSRSILLPSRVDADKVEAQYRNGVLMLTLPKAQDSKAQRITVRS